MALNTLDIRLLSKLHLVAKLMLFGIFAAKFLEPGVCTCFQNFAANLHKNHEILSTKASFERSLFSNPCKSAGYNIISLNL